MKNDKLHNIKKTGFKAPDDYFEALEDQIMNKLKSNDDGSLNDIQNTGFNTPDRYFETLETNIMNKLNDDLSLDTIKNTGFEAPDNYFETLEEGIMQGLKENEVVKVIPLFSRKNALYISGIAAAVLIMFGIFINRIDKGFDALDVDVVASYLELQDLSTFEIASILTEEDLSEDDFGTINDTFSEESLEDYLIENANLEDIIEQ